MIRVFAFMSVFLLSIIGILLLQPGGDTQTSAGTMDVTRSGNGSLLDTRPATLPAAMAQTNFGPRLQQAQAQVQATEPMPSAAAPASSNPFASQLRALQAATQSSLAGTAAEPAANADMRSLTSNALASLRANAPLGATSGAGQVRLASLVDRAMDSAGGDDFFAAVLREAQSGGQQYSQLARAVAATGTNDVNASWLGTSNPQVGAEALMKITRTAVGGSTKSQIHVVKAGDSLMNLAIRYYGASNGYKLIFEANQDVLQSPDKIRIGQKLKIPPMKNV